MKNHDEQLNQLFKSLPREEADDYFTKRVSAHLGSQKKERSVGGMKLVLAGTALATICAFLLPILLKPTENPERKALVDELAAIRAEHTALASQAATMEKENDQLPVLYLGGDDKNDYVLDLAKLSHRDSNSGGLRARPATYQTQENTLNPDMNPRVPAGYQGGPI